MPKKWTRAGCFEHFGAVCKNPRWSWSARSPDGKTVVMTMWQDEIGRDGDLMTYQSRPRPPGEETRPGALERIENLKWARDYCDSLVRVVIMRAEDVKASPRTIADCYPHEKLVMRITYLDEGTGAFRAESVN
jgi:hypothetical protein